MEYWKRSILPVAYGLLNFNGELSMQNIIHQQNQRNRPLKSWCEVRVIYHNSGRKERKKKERVDGGLRLSTKLILDFKDGSWSDALVFLSRYQIQKFNILSQYQTSIQLIFVPYWGGELSWACSTQENILYEHERQPLIIIFNFVKIFSFKPSFLSR